MDLQNAPGAAHDWAADVKRYKDALTPEKLEELSNELELPADALESLNVGYCEDEYEEGYSGCYAFPEFDAERRVRVSAYDGREGA